jgi:hypothetical protein
VQYRIPIGNKFYYVDLGTDYKVDRCDKELKREGYTPRALRKSTTAQSVYENYDGRLKQGDIANGEIVDCNLVSGKVEKVKYNGTTYVHIWYYNAKRKSVIDGWTNTDYFTTNLDNSYWYF